MTDLFNPSDIDKAMEAVAVPGSFDSKKFFEMTGMNKMQQDQLKEAFDFLDVNQNGFLDYYDIQNFLRTFRSGSRPLTDKETNDILETLDRDGDNRISFDEFLDNVIL